MNEDLNKIKFFLIESFKINDLRRMLFETLSIIKYGHVNTEFDLDYEVLIYDETSEKDVAYQISLSDDLKILQYKLFCEDNKDFRFIVNVAIGDFKANNESFTTYKCLATFEINFDLNWYNIEFSILEPDKL